VLAVALLAGDGSREEVALLDAESGVSRGRRRIAVHAGHHCIAATNAGWLVVQGGRSGPRGRPTSTKLDSNGVPAAATPLDEPLNGCALLATPSGELVLAYTHPADVTETNHLFVRRLDSSGRPASQGVRIGDVSFARDPVLARVERGVVLLAFGDALGREVRAIALDDGGVPRGDVVTLASTYGFGGFAVWRGDLVWGTEDALGRRSCLVDLVGGVSPQPPASPQP
jgi:hypothetical protein